MRDGIHQRGLCCVLWSLDKALLPAPVIPIPLNPFCVCSPGALASRSVCCAGSRRVYVGECGSLGGAPPSQPLITSPGPSTVPVFLTVLLPDTIGSSCGRVRAQCHIQGTLSGLQDTPA